MLPKFTIKSAPETINARDQNWDLLLSDLNHRDYGMDDPGYQDFLEGHELGSQTDDCGYFDGHGMSLVSEHVLFC